jgi:hypothetical protein
MLQETDFDKTLEHKGSWVTTHRKLLGTVLFSLGLASCLLVGAIMPYTFAVIGRSSLPDFAATIVSSAPVILCVIIIALSESLFLPSYFDVAARDRRPPVIYLRPFHEDAFKFSHAIPTMVAGIPIPIILGNTADSYLKILNAIGPVVAIGRPSWLAKLGIYPSGPYRLYVDSEDWQLKVKQLIASARMVVLVVGDSGGIEWEIDMVKELVPPQALLLYIPPKPIGSKSSRRPKKTKDIYEAYRNMIEQRLPTKLPEFQESVFCIGFTSQWIPILRPSERKKWWVTDLEYASKQVREQLKYVLGKTMPGVQLESYRVFGRGGQITRIMASIVTFAVGVYLGILALR